MRFIMYRVSHPEIILSPSKTLQKQQYHLQYLWHLTWRWKVAVCYEQHQETHIYITIHGKPHLQVSQHAIHYRKCYARKLFL